jgi:type I restriction enzyme, S subunit
MKKGWQTKTFDEVLEIRNGRNQREVESPSGEFPIYGSAGNVMGMATDYLCEAGTTIIGRKGNINSPIYAETRFWNVDTAFGLAVKAGLDSRFLYFFCLFYDFGPHNRGTTIPSLVKSELLNIPIPVPPLPEQQRIVGLLDEAFEGLATAKTNAEKNLQNARALFESHLQSVFTQRGEGWVEKSVRQIAAPAKGSIRTGPFGSQLLHSEFVDEGIAVLGIDNAVTNEFCWGKSRFITPEKYRQLERYTVHPGDVLITIMGTCGRCAIVPDDIPIAINTKHICCITLDRKQCLPSYLHIYFLHAPQSQVFLAKHAKGAIMAGLNMGLIQQLPVMLPPIKVQAAIIEAADSLHEQTHHLTRIYSRKLAALDALKKSLLHQAFAGEL